MHGTQVQQGSLVLQKDLNLVFAMNIPLEVFEDSDDNFNIDIILKLTGGHLTKPCILSNTINSNDLQSSAINRFQLKLFEDELESSGFVMMDKEKDK